jgi:uncharacterized protein (TIGR02145 family)
LTEPKVGTILDLNSTARGGLILSNVTIVNPELIPYDANAFPGITNSIDADVNPGLRGAMVYNDGQGTSVPAGIYIWNGYCWTKDGGDRTVSVPSITINGTATDSYAIIENGTVTFAVVSPQAGVSYEWYESGTPISVSAGNTYTTQALPAGTYGYYCTATSDACPSSNMTSSLLTVTVDIPYSLPAGSGSLAGRACFDVMKGNSGAGCGTPATRNPFSANFTQSATNTQEYIFSPSGTVSKLRFYAVEDEDHTGQIIESIEYSRALETQTGISGEQTLSIVYKNDLNDEAANTDNSDALRFGIFAVYNDAPDGSGTDRSVKLTALIKDCQCCGAYLNAAHTQWLNFSCHNLGATESAAPFTPDAALHGAKYKWGVKDPALTQIEDQTTANDGGYGTGWSTKGPVPPSDSNVDWDMKNANPCPVGWRLPAQNEWKNIINNNDWTRLGQTGWIPGTGINNYYGNGYMVGDALFLPAAGYRHEDNGGLGPRGSHGYYWSNDAYLSNGYALGYDQNHATAATEHNMPRSYAHSVRCVAE